MDYASKDALSPYYALPERLARRKDLPFSAIVVYAALADQLPRGKATPADAHRPIWITAPVALLAWKTGLSRRHIRRLLRILEAAQLLARQEHPGRPSRYALLAAPAAKHLQPEPNSDGQTSALPAETGSAPRTPASAHPGHPRPP